MNIVKINSTSTEIPQEMQVRHLSGTLYEFIGHADVTEETQVFGDETKTVYKSTMTHLTSHIYDKGEMISALVRLRYTQDAEFALINKGIANSEDAEYVAYRAYVQLCKEQANTFEL